MLLPKLATTLRDYSREQFTADLVAGLIVGVVALPLAIAFGIASGVTPAAGLWTAIVAGFLISALGGSRVQIGEPTGAFVVIVAGIVAQYGTAGLATATLLAGLMLVAFGLLGLGSVIKFIPHPLITGFTSGIAVLIASSQVKDALGLAMPTPPAEFIVRLEAYAQHLGTAHAPAVGVTAVTLAILVLWPRVTTRVPAPFVALVTTTLGVHWLGVDVETVGSRFGALPSGLPSLQLPDLATDTIRALIGPAFSIALLGGIESLLSAVVADGMIGGRHRSNVELVAQGVANIASPLVGGIPATGAIARTATNVKNGGRTPVAGIVHALTLLVITLFAGGLAARIPMATLAGILLAVSYHMSEWRSFVAELRSPKSDVAVLLAAFLLTVFVDLTVAIQVGMILASLLFVRRMASAARVTVLGGSTPADEDGPDPVLAPPPPPGVQVYVLAGPFFFGAAETFKETLRAVAKRPRALVLWLRDVPMIDGTGLRALREVVEQSHRDGTAVFLAEVPAQPREAIARSPLGDALTAETWCETLADAYARAGAAAAARGPTPRATSAGQD
jgi:SulP family sulfate permease